MLLVIVLGLPLAAAPFLALAGSRLRHRVGWVALVFPLLSVLGVAALAVRVGEAGSLVLEWEWIPSLGINLSFLVDGLALFFALVVSGMGCLVVFYAIFYLGRSSAHQGRFFCYLLLFMAAMLGTVLANNLMMMFVFWELTGLASFLLIGFLHEEEGSRVGARQALLVTSLTGLLMLVGIIMLEFVTGTYDLSVILAEGLPAGEHRGWLTAAMGLMLVGAFGKSAQFPLHFWLPNAMAAPTPVSAYLHSATMVKLGVFFCARVFPMFVENSLWAPLLAWVGFSTLLVGGVLALLSHELKAILAYSTVSQLGYLIGYYGLGSARGVEHDYLHILNHVLYKGCWFMIAGAVIHATGLKDIRALGGLFRRLPMLGLGALVASAAMAGLPGTTGFLSKEAMFAEIFEAVNAHGVLGAYAIGAVVVTSLVKVAFSVRLFAGIFLGREPEGMAGRFHAPPLALQVPPLMLAGAALVFGLMPGILAGPFRWLAVSGLNRPGDLALWHGVNREFVASVVVVVVGFGVYLVGHRTGWRWHRIPEWLQFDRIFECGVSGLSTFSRWVTRGLRADDPLDYLPILLAFMVSAVGGALVVHCAPGREGGAFWWTLTAGGVQPIRVLVAGLIGLSVFGVVVLRRWTTQLIALSAAGFLTCLYFVLYRAPDLALTQILIEAATLILLLLVLGRFPRSAELGEVTRRMSPGRRGMNLGIALGVGMVVTTFVLAVTANPHPERLGPFFLEHTVDLAGGSNAVNTILVDFRGFDTLGEITVLVAAMLGCLGLLMRYKRTAAEYREGPLGPPGFGAGEGRRR